jgi:hypothetical protein
MRTFLIELFHKLMEALLLHAKTRDWRSRRFRFQRPVKSFVPAVVLGLARGNALRLDAQLQPPDR